MRIVEHKGQYRVTIPKDLVKDKDWGAGTEIRFVEDTEGNIFLREIKPVKRPR